jgi:predicted Zn-ribbon and HTH transcriptional regulator
LRKAPGDTTEIIKGINSWAKLKKGFQHSLNISSSAYAETDMRALYNPTRMEVIGLAAEKLVKKIQSLCPGCSTPGFGITASTKGLPCSSCGFATQSNVSCTRQCTKCGFSLKEMFTYHKTTEDPMYCDICNP